MPLIMLVRMTCRNAEHARSCRSGNQHGMTLIEVLVALVILSVGLLTAVGLQLVSKRNNLDASQRTLAARMASDVIERMRANRTAAALAIYVGEGAALGGGTIDSEPSPACTASAPCTAANVARHDLWFWETEMDGASEQISEAGTPVNAGGLAYPTGCITGPGDGGSGIYTITIAFRGGVEIPTNTAVTCGNGKTEYGANGEFRRTVSMQVYITN